MYYNKVILKYVFKRGSTESAKTYRDYIPTQGHINIAKEILDSDNKIAVYRRKQKGLQVFTQNLYIEPSSTTTHLPLTTTASECMQLLLLFINTNLYIVPI